jgi:AmmeMemoRadiSam system protein B
MMTPGAEIFRPCGVCGMFYPVLARPLQDKVRSLIQESRPRIVPGKIRALISPHAGYRFSGRTAACGYKLLEGTTYDGVLIVSPSHHEYFEGICVYSGDAYATPMGKMKVQKELRDRLLSVCDVVVAGVYGHGRREHAIEVQLPFLQEILPGVHLVPVVMGDQRPDLCIALGKGLSVLASEWNLLLIASTDLSHYHSREEAEELDGVMVEDIKAGDYSKLLDDLASGRTEACGGGPAAAILAALAERGGAKFEVLDYSNSGDVTGDYSEVVGYLSAVAYN